MRNILFNLQQKNKQKSALCAQARRGYIPTPCSLVNADPYALKTYDVLIVHALRCGHGSSLLYSGLLLSTKVRFVFLLHCVM